jgi:hypothetical protein
MTTDNIAKRSMATAMLLAGIVFFFCASIAAAQTQYWLYGITGGNRLVRFDPNNNFAQSTVGQITITGVPGPIEFQGIEYDYQRNRLLIASRNGLYFVVDQNTGVGDLLTNMTALVGAQPLGSIAVQPSSQNLPQSRVFSSLGGVQPVQLQPLLFKKGVTSAGQLVQQGLIELFSEFTGGVAWRYSPPSLFLAQTPETAFQILSEFDPDTGAPIDNTFALPDSALGMTGMAFHPVTNELYGNKFDGTVIKFSQVTAPFDTTVVLLPSNPNSGPVKDLAFLPVTPTPTPTPTSTPTSTPTPTATPIDPRTLCPSGFITACGCDKVEVRLANGTVQCGPVDTLSKSTTLPAPQVVVSKRRVVLLFKTFSAITDGRSFRLVAKSIRVPARLEGDVVVAEVDADIVDGSLKPTAVGAPTWTADGSRLNATATTDFARARNLTLRYEAQITPRGSLRANQRVSILTKRNRITVSKLNKGSYTARYRVNILRGGKQVGSTKFSKGTRFKVS